MSSPAVLEEAGVSAKVLPLLPAALDVAIELGALPPRDLLKNTLHIGSDRAGEIRTALARINWDLVGSMFTGGDLAPEHREALRASLLRMASGESAGPVELPAAPSPRRLTAVPDLADAETSDAADESITTPGQPDQAAVPARADAETADPPMPGGSVDASVDAAEVTMPPAPGEITPSAETDTATSGSVVPTDPPGMSESAAPVVDQAAPSPDTAPDSPAPASSARRKPVWPVLILCLPAFVAIWSGWVELGQMSGFGVVQPLPGIVDDFHLNTAITLPIGVETYAAYALWAWLSGIAGTAAARRFAKWSALASLAVGALGQVAYHLMSSWGWTTAPWPITAAVACLPVAVLGMGAALAHLLHSTDEH
ncbi:ABC transporter permease [Catenuloplanes japonicus]|uniref:ABC transporter permease n=1 Tax=Catenuloplanes japonicus TaxID=33876 RepID=UPI0038BCE48C